MAPFQPARNMFSFFLTFLFFQAAVGGSILGSILNPLLEVIDTVGSGAGLIQGTLGGVAGILGVDQR